MSISFDEKMNKKASQFLKENYGDSIVAIDDTKALIDDLFIQQSEMKTLANKAKQTVDVTIHNNDDIETMSDGTKYKVTKNGWKKILTVEQI